MKPDVRLHQNPIVYQADAPLYNLVQLEERKGGKPEDVERNARAQVDEVANLLGIPADRLRLQVLNYNMYMLVDADSPSDAVCGVVSRELRWYAEYLRLRGDTTAHERLVNTVQPRGNALVLPRKLLSPAFAKLVTPLA